MSWMDDEMRRQMLFNDSMRRSLIIDTSVASAASIASAASVSAAYAASKDALSIAGSTVSKDLLGGTASIVSTDPFKFADATRAIQGLTAQPSYIQDLINPKAAFASLVAQSASLDYARKISEASVIAKQATAYWELDKSRFEIPSTLRLTELTTVAAGIRAAHLSISDTVTAMSRIQTPWLDTRNPLGSVSSFASIQEIGLGVNSTPFEPKFMAALRGQLGDWRDVESVPPTIFDDAAERSKFYIARGFRSELGDFTFDALEEIIENAGLGPDEDEDEPDFRLLERSYAHVIRIEHGLRIYVNAVMTDAFGEDWMSFDGDMVKRWKETKEKRLAEGRPARSLLIHYSELSDLCAIMERKDHFPLFKPVFKRKEAMQETFRRVLPARHAVMHVGKVTAIDYLTVMLDHAHLRRAFKREED